MNFLSKISEQENIEECTVLESSKKKPSIINKIVMNKFYYIYIDLNIYTSTSKNGYEIKIMYVHMQDCLLFHNRTGSFITFNQ